MQRNKTRILAIDPGTKEMGYAAFNGDTLTDYGVKAVRREKLDEPVLARLERAVATLLREKRPHKLILEQNHFSQIKQNLGLTVAVAKMKGIARKHKVPVMEYHPRTIRKVVCQNGNATKHEVAQIVCSRLPELKPYLRSDRRWRERYYQNIFDAVAAGLCYLEREHGRKRS